MGALSLLASCSGGGIASSPAAVEGGPGDAGASSTDAAPRAEASAAPFLLESPVFAEGGPLPPEHRCAGAPSPPLTWSGVPPATQSFAVVLRDLDYMNGYLHWVIFDIPAGARELPSGVPAGYEPATPAGAKQASALGQVYFGPCSPIRVNTYEFTLYALDVATLAEATPTSTGAEVVPIMEQHSIARATLHVESGP